MGFLFVAATTLLAAQVSIAFDPSTDRARCNRGQELCLSSFIWCSDGSGLDNSRGCNYPENTYPMYNRDYPQNEAGVVSTVMFNLTWQNADPAYPVVVEYHFPVGGDLASRNAGPWTRNVTGDQLELMFSLIFADYASPDFNLSQAEVAGLAASVPLNYFRISQPDRPLPSDFNSTGDEIRMPYIDTSDRFLVLGPYVPLYMETNTEIALEGFYDGQERKWRLGVGIGVGLDVPLLMVATFVAGSMYASHRARHGMVKDPKALSTSS